MELRRSCSSECPRKPTRRKGREDGGAGVVARCAKRSARKGGKSAASAGAEDVGVGRKSDRCNAAFRGGVVISEACEGQSHDPIIPAKNGAGRLRAWTVMEEKEVFNRVKKVVVAQLGVPPDSVTMADAVTYIKTVA